MASRNEAVTEQMYGLIVPELVSAFRALEIMVPSPKKTSLGGEKWAYRYQEKLPQQAVVLKLSRVVSGIQATWVLLRNGFTQEAAALQRILDEIGEDILFLSGPLTVGSEEPSHVQFILEFFQEEFDEGKSAIDSNQNRHRVPRRKIRAYNARTFHTEYAVHETVAVLETIDSAYSGFIHAAAVHALDVYGGEPARFHVEGMLGTARLDDAMADFRNYLHRCLLDAAMVAKALGQNELFGHLLQTSNRTAVRFDML